jgi:REP element-mobilizing transposase RayT
MSSHRQILYHIVFRTKSSRKSLPLSVSDELYRYIWGIIKAKNCVLYRINGMEDHIHFLSDLHPSIALADYLRDIKTSTSVWLKQNKNFPDFEGWGEGYAAFTYAYSDKETVVNYILNQREHHKKISFADELRQLLKEHGIEIDERFFLND